MWQTKHHAPCLKKGNICLGSLKGFDTYSLPYPYLSKGKMCQIRLLLSNYNYIQKNLPEKLLTVRLVDSQELNMVTIFMGGDAHLYSILIYVLRQIKSRRNYFVGSNQKAYLCTEIKTCGWGRQVSVQMLQLA